jgi:hypothetical protein
MAITKTSKNFKNKGKDIKYLNKDFSEFRGNLIEFAKTYFPKTYSDFNESSPGMMFMEMASYVGDVLSFYLDNQIHLYTSSDAFLIVLWVLLFFYISLIFNYIFIASKHEKKLVYINLFITIFNIV